MVELIILRKFGETNPSFSSNFHDFCKFRHGWVKGIAGNRPLSSYFPKLPMVLYGRLRPVECPVKVRFHGTTFIAIICIIIENEPDTYFGSDIHMQ